MKDANIYDTKVPGAFELPLATRFLALSRQCDVVIALGTLIKGDTMHFEYIADAVANGLMSVSHHEHETTVLGCMRYVTDPLPCCSLSMLA